MGPPAGSRCRRWRCGGRAAGCGSSRSGRISIAPAVQATIDPAARLAEGVVGDHVISLQHRQPGADVSQRDRQVDDVVDLLDDPVSRADVKAAPVAVDDLQVWVLRPRRGQQRSQAEEKRALSDSRGAVRRAGSRRRLPLRGQRPHSGPNPGIRGDVGHAPSLPGRPRRRQPASSLAFCAANSSSVRMPWLFSSPSSLS